MTAPMSRRGGGCSATPPYDELKQKNERSRKKHPSPYRTNVGLHRDTYANTEELEEQTKDNENNQNSGQIRGSMYVRRS